MTDLHVILPGDIDDPSTPSGGNVYDRRVLDALAATGWDVVEHAVAGHWPWASVAARVALTEVLARIPDGALVLLDGLIASTAPDVLVAQARRLRLVVLVHMPLGHQPVGEEDQKRERAVLSAAVA